MERKCITIFLMGLLCLVSSGELFSQHCYKVSYDKKGNRINYKSVNCSNYWRDNYGDTNIIENDDGQIDEFTVYPNPNNGIFSIKTSEDYNEAELQVYNNKGVLLSRFQISGEKEIDISDKPSGVYLLRIIEGDEVRSVAVVKL